MKMASTSIMTPLVIAPTAVPTAAVTRPSELMAWLARLLKSSGVVVTPNCCNQPPMRLIWVSTIVRILEKKGFVGHEAFGKTHLYRPLVAKEDYTQAFLKNFVKDYFDDSYQELVSFFARDRNLTVSELEEILSALREEIKKQKADKDA